ncbi:MAG: hypothetical protein ACQESP_01065 [Candidatus Muiribacteriota bacterium]
MLVKQLVVEAKNRPGELHNIVKLLSSNNVDIKAIVSNAQTSDNIVIAKVRMIVLNDETAIEVLKKEGYKAYLENVVVVDVSDTPGSFAPVLELFDKNDINIEYVYTFLTHIENKALSVFCFDNNEKALEILKDSQYTVVTDSTIQSRYGDSEFYEERDLREYLSTIITP